MWGALRVITFAFQDIVRNMSLSFMTVLILVLMLLSVNTLLGIRIITETATTNIRNDIDVSIYIAHDASEEQVSEVKEYVSSFSEVDSVTFLTAQEVEKEFREQHKENPDILASLDELGENPFGPTLIVQTDQTHEYQKIIHALDVPEYENVVEAKTFADTERAIERIGTITDQVERFSIALTGFFAVIAFLIIFNTIRVAIYTQRIEISIKKLVGATNWFIRGPYLVESLVFSLLSVAITFALLLFAAGMIDPYLSFMFDHSTFLTNYLWSNILWLAGVQFVAVLLLTMISSMMAMRRHLRA